MYSTVLCKTVWKVAKGQRIIVIKLRTSSGENLFKIWMGTLTKTQVEDDI